jgi:SAM-dependent methyltransferase
VRAGYCVTAAIVVAPPPPPSSSMDGAAAAAAAAAAAHRPCDAGVLLSVPCSRGAGGSERLWRPSPCLAAEAATVESALGHSRAQPRAALDIGCGTGRDCVFLGERGWRVQVRLSTVRKALGEGRMGWTDVRGGGRTQGIDHLEKQCACPDSAVVPPCPGSAPDSARLGWMGAVDLRHFCGAVILRCDFAPFLWRFDFCGARPLVRCTVARARQLAELHDAGGRCQFTCLDVERLLVSSEAVDAGMKQLQGPFDLVHLARFLHRPLLPALRDHFVKPGGMLVCECPSSPTDTRPLPDIAARSDAIGSHVSHRHRPHVHVRLRKVWAAARSR